MCENLIWIGLNRKYVIFGEGQKPHLGGLHVICDAHFRTWPNSSSQKQCVKIWFGLVEPFKSYISWSQANKKKKKKKKTSKASRL